LTGTRTKRDAVWRIVWEASVTATLLKIAKDREQDRPAIFGEAELKGMHRVPIARFPKHLIFYQARESDILILRVVHGARDLESLFALGESSKS